MLRVSDYLSIRLKDLGCEIVYMVTGGAAMHLNDAFGKTFKNKIINLHHEQSCSMAAESYARILNKPAIVNVTSGPGSINALNGVFGAYVDSLPMIVISGQAKRATLKTNSGIKNLRQLGDQEVNIIEMVKGITKYAVLIKEEDSIFEEIDKSFKIAISDRPGPVWIDIPIDIQSKKINFNFHGNCIEPKAFVENIKKDILRAPKKQLITLAKNLISSKRPTLLVGSGIRTSDSYESFLSFLKKWPISTTTAWNSNDLLWDDHQSYTGRPGTVGNRAGNFCVQFSDCICIIGSRLNIRQISFNWDSFGKNAWKCHVDIDQAELNKPTLNTDLKIHANIKFFFDDLSDAMEEIINKENLSKQDLFAKWRNWINWNKKYLNKYSGIHNAIPPKNNLINPYRWVDLFSEITKENSIIVCADGTACVVGFQAFKIKPNQRLYHNSGCASMGYELPAAIGAYHASKKTIYCIAGDGSIMMNLQELAYIGGKKLPIKIFLFNNNGYHSIRQTQKNYFPDNLVGCGKESGLPFPNFRKLAEGFGLEYKLTNNENLIKNDLKEINMHNLPTINEIILDLDQQFAPKLSSKKLEDGTMITSELEEMAPFLPKGVLDNIKKEAFNL